MSKQGCQDIAWTAIKDIPKAAITEVSTFIAIWLQQTRDDVNDAIDYTLLMLALMLLGFVMGYCCYDRPPKFIKKTMIPMTVAGIGMALIYNDDLLKSWKLGELEMIQNRRIDFNADPVSDMMVFLEYFGITFFILEACRVTLHLLSRSSCSKSSVEIPVMPDIAVAPDPTERFLPAVSVNNQVGQNGRQSGRGDRRQFHRFSHLRKKRGNNALAVAGYGLQSTSTSGADTDPDPAHISHLYRLHSPPSPKTNAKEVDGAHSPAELQQLVVKLDGDDDPSAETKQLVVRSDNGGDSSNSISP